MNLDTDFLWSVFLKALAKLPVNFEIAIVALVVAIPLGLLAAIVCNNKVPVASQALKVFVSFIRSTPPILLILIIYYVKKSLDMQGVIKIDPIWYAIFIFSLIEIALLTEVFRSALLSIPATQLEAAESIGMTKLQGYRRIVIPQVLGVALPVLCSSITDLVKMTSLAFALTVVDIMAIAKIEGGFSLSFMEAYLAVSLIYLIVVFVLERIFKIFERFTKSYADK
ncbi:MAG: amino acid ABC transporter permease [Oscillospiraceae bacterium]|jgi:L-cystine transport system permease protein|nr:amino acid ABC transporter permease [Oscillospiraceae bacterium]